MAQWFLAPMLLASILVLAAVPVAHGLYRIYDEYAIEVHLDKPGIEYNLTRISRLNPSVADMAGVKAYFYHSPLNKEVGVFIYIVGYPGSLAVRVQAPIIYSGSQGLRPGKDIEEAAETLMRRGYGVVLHNNTLVAVWERYAQFINVTIMYSGGNYAVVNLTLYSYTDIPRNLTSGLSADLGEALGASIDAGKLLGTRPHPMGGLVNGTLAAVLVYELYRLLSEGVVRGLNTTDIGEIISLARPGAAGPGGHIYYDEAEKTWMSPLESGRFYILTSTGETRGSPATEATGQGNESCETPSSESVAAGTGAGEETGWAELAAYPLLAGLVVAAAAYIVARRML